MAVREGQVFRGQAQAPGWGAAPGPFRRFGRGQGAAGAGVDEAAVAGVGRVGHVELGAAAKARVQVAVLPQAVKIVRIDTGTLALIRDSPVVPGQPQPFQVGQDEVRERPGTTQGIQVLHAQEKRAALTFGTEPGGQRGVQIAQVHPPARRGRKAAARGPVGFGGVRDRFRWGHLLSVA